MKIHSILLAASLFAAPAFLHADAPDTPLEKQMQILARGTKQLSMQVSDPAQQQSTVTLLEKLVKATADSKTLDPRKTASVPQADREKFLADYRAQMQKLSDAFTQIEEAVKAGKYDDVKALLATVGPIKKEGHSKFKQD